MIAKIAGSSDVTGAEQTTDTSAAAAGAAEDQHQEIHSEAIGDRLGGLLGTLNLPEGVAETELGSGDPGAGAGSGAGAGGQEQETDEERQQREAAEQQAAAGAAAGDGELTDEEKNQWPPEALARIKKLTAQKLKERERAEAAEQKLAGATKVEAPIVLQPTKENPFAHIQSEQQLNQEVETLQHWRDWCELNPEGDLDVPIPGVMKDGKPATMDITAEQARQLKVEVRRALEQVPKVQTFLTERKAHDVIAEKDFPEIWGEAETPEKEMARQVIRSMPQILQRADASIQIGLYVRARKEYDAKKAAGAAGKQQPGKTVNPALAPFTNRSAPKKAPLLPQVQRPSTTPAGQGASTQKVAEAEARAAEAGGDPNSMLELTRSLREANANHRGGSRVEAT